MDRSAEASLLVRVDSACIHEIRMVRRRQRRRVRDNTGPLYSALSNEQTAESDITLHTASDALWNSALHRIVPPVELEVPWSIASIRSPLNRALLKRRQITRGRALQSGARNGVALT